MHRARPAKLLLAFGAAVAIVALAVVKRFDADTEPTDSSIVRAVDRELKR